MRDHRCCDGRGFGSWLYGVGIPLLRNDGVKEFVRDTSVQCAVAEGYRQIVRVAEGQKEELAGRRGLLRHLKDLCPAGI
jgi:hypothetical protein